jgi:hypothetical protein
VDNFFTVFLLLVFVLGPIVEQMKKKEQERKRQQQQLPPEPPVALPRSSTEEISSKPRDSAAGMVPDDLWAVLTGEQRPAPQVPAPLPEAAKNRPWDVVYIPPEETDDEEDFATEDVNVEVRRSSRDAVQREHAARHRPVEALSLEVTKANIISLETPLPSAAARHTAFHQKVDRKVAPAEVMPSRKELLKLATRSELQRAFVLQEILGKPRGLE